MNLAAVQSAELLGVGSVRAVTVTRGALILQYAQLVVMKLRYRLSPGKGDQSTAKSAMPRIKNPVKLGPSRN